MESAEQRQQDKKQFLGLWMCTALVVGNMIGSGVFLLPSTLASIGPISIFGWLFTAAGAIVLALIFSRLSRLEPDVGGPYAYARTGFGDFAGFLVAWGYWISIWSANAAISVALVSYLAVFWKPLATNRVLGAVVGIAAIWLLTWVNAMGIRRAGWVQLITTILKLIPLGAVAFIGLFYLNTAHFSPMVQGDLFPLSALTASASLTLFAFLGLESATVPAGNIVDPRRTIPRATTLGTVIAAAIYIAGTVAVMGIIPIGSLAGSNAPFADAASIIWGPWARYAVALGAAVSCFGALNGWILLQGQMPFAVARDRLFPKSFGHLSKRGTPVVGLVVSSALVSLLLIMNFTRGLVEKFQFIILLATMTCLVPYIFSSLAEVMIMIKLKGDKPLDRKRMIKALALGIPGFVYSAWTIAGSGAETVYWGFLLLIAGIPVYVWFKWRQATGSPHSFGV